MSTQENSMNTMFIGILQKLITEQGKEALLNPAKCKAFLADYTKGEYKKESRLLLQALEAGVQKAIDTTDELEICKKQQARILREEHFVAPEAAADIVDTLAFVLRDEKKIITSQRVICSNCGKELQKEWKICPYCETRVENTKSLSKKTTSQKIDTVSSNSRSTIDITQHIKSVITSTKADSIPPNSSTPIVSYTNPKNVSGQILKEGKMMYKRGLSFPNEKGNLLLYSDRLEWKGIKNFVIPLGKISTVNIDLNGDLVIIMLDQTKFYFQGLVFNSEESEVSWLNGINNVLNQTQSRTQNNKENSYGWLITLLLILGMIIIIAVTQNY